MENQNQDTPKLRQAVIRRTVEFILAGFALVAALAWNEAIQALFKTIFGDVGSLMAKFGYAIVVTAIVTVISIRLSRWGGDQN